MKAGNFLFPYNIGDGGCYGVKWEGTTLSMTICRYYLDESDPNEIEVEFYGVEWMRSTTNDDVPPRDNPIMFGYDPEIPMEEYPLISQEDFQKDYIEYVAHGQLNAIRLLDKNVVFIDDIMFFSCTEIKVIWAICNPDIKKR